MSQLSQKYLGASKKVLITGGAQGLVQLVGIICGLIILRCLPTEEYALYTLANTLLGTMTILADAGVGIGCMSLSGKVWKNPVELGVVLSTGMHIRKKFAVLSLLISLPFLSYLLYKHGASSFAVVFIVISIIPAFLSSLSDSLLEIPIKLHQDIVGLQKNQLVVNVVRLVLTFIFLIIFPFSGIAILAFGVPRVYGNIQLRKISNRYANHCNIINTDYKSNILRLVYRSLPGAIYYCLSGQLNIWLISLFGNTKSIAQLGALGRLSMMFSIVSVIISTVFIPRFARIENNRLIRKYFIGLELFLIAFSFLTVIFFYFFPQPAYWLLGKKYSDLGHLLVLSVVSSCLTLVLGNTYSTYSARGYVMSPVRSISVSVLSIILGICLFNVSTLEGVLFMNILVTCLELVNHWIYSAEKIFLGNN